MLAAFFISIPLLQFSVSSTNNRLVIDSNDPPPDDTTYISSVPNESETQEKSLINQAGSHTLYGAIEGNSNRSYSTA